MRTGIDAGSIHRGVLELDKQNPNISEAIPADTLKET